MSRKGINIQENINHNTQIHEHLFLVKKHLKFYVFLSETTYNLSPTSQYLKIWFSPNSEATLALPRVPHWPDRGPVLPCTLHTQPSISTPAIILKQLAVRRHSEHGHGFHTGRQHNRQTVAAGPRWGFISTGNVAVRWRISHRPLRRLNISWTSAGNDFTCTWKESANKHCTIVVFLNKKLSTKRQC